MAMKKKTKKASPMKREIFVVRTTYGGYSVMEDTPEKELEYGDISSKDVVGKYTLTQTGKFKLVMNEKKVKK